MSVPNLDQRRRHPLETAYPQLAACCLSLALLASPALAETKAAETREQASDAPPEASNQAEQGLGEDPSHERPFQEEKIADQPVLRFPPPDASGQQSYPYLQLNGLIEAGWVHIDPYEGPAASEWLISTLELGMTFQPHPWVTLEASGLYEDNGQTPLELDVAQLKIGPPAGPWFLAGGQFYLPFGRYESNMVSDPLTLDLGENREIGAALGFEYASLFGAAYSYQGERLGQQGGGLDEWGAEVGYAGKPNGYPLTLAVGYISDIGDSDSLYPLVEDNDRIGGLALSVLFEAGPWTLIGEYVAATQPFDDSAGEALAGQSPAAWMLEVAYQFDLFTKEAQIALGYQGSREALALELPEVRGLATFNLGIYRYTTLQLEWALDQDYGESAGGTGNSGNGFTAQIAVAF
jgi:hypothetical protein